MWPIGVAVCVGGAHCRMVQKSTVSGQERLFRILKCIFGSRRAARAPGSCPGAGPPLVYPPPPVSRRIRQRRTRNPWQRHIWKSGLHCSINSFRFLRFLLWFVLGPEGLREAPGKAHGGLCWASPGAPGAPGARVQKPKNPYCLQGPLKRLSKWRRD